MNETNVQTATLIVIDDNEGDLKLLQAQIRRYGLAVRHESFETAESFLSWWEGTKRRDVIVLSDYRLPGASGCDIAFRLGHEVPVFVMTASRQADDRDAALAAGARGFFVKPLRREDFAVITAAPAVEGSS